jgi:hypothetical protein
VNNSLVTSPQESFRQKDEGFNHLKFKHWAKLPKRQPYMLEQEALVKARMAELRADPNARMTWHPEGTDKRKEIGAYIDEEYGWLDAEDVERKPSEGGLGVTVASMKEHDVEGTTEYTIGDGMRVGVAIGPPKKTLHVFALASVKRDIQLANPAKMPRPGYRDDTFKTGLRNHSMRKWFTMEQIRDAATKVTEAEKDKEERLRKEAEEAERIRKENEAMFAQQKEQRRMERESQMKEVREKQTADRQQQQALQVQLAPKFRGFAGDAGKKIAAPKPKKKPSVRSLNLFSHCQFREYLRCDEHMLC